MPHGDSSFANVVVYYEMVAGGVSAPHTNPDNALGAPNYDGINNCGLSDPDTCSFVSLGLNGVLVVRFDDNFLTGSGDNAPDPWVFEVGPLAENTRVEISADGTMWHSVGMVAGATAGVDLDAYGFGIEDLFRYVHLSDLA